MSHIKFERDFDSEELKRYHDIYDKLPKPCPEFDSDGLRFPVHVLNELGMNNIVFPIEVMAQFVDGVTKKAVDNDESTIDIQMESGRKMLDDFYKEFNATTIGNLAYITLNHKKESTRDNAKEFLEEIFAKELNLSNG